MNFSSAALLRLLLPLLLLLLLFGDTCVLVVSASSGNIGKTTISELFGHRQQQQQQQQHQQHGSNGVASAAAAGDAASPLPVWRRADGSGQRGPSASATAAARSLKQQPSNQQDDHQQQQQQQQDGDDKEQPREFLGNPSFEETDKSPVTLSEDDWNLLMKSSADQGSQRDSARLRARGLHAKGWEPLCAGYGVIEGDRLAHSGSRALLLDSVMTKQYVMDQRKTRVAANSDVSALVDRMDAKAKCGPGAVQHVRVQQKKTYPLMISGWATGLDNRTSSFSLSVVLTFKDGSASQEILLYFTGDFDRWQNRCIHVEALKPVRSAIVFLTYEHEEGAALLDDVQITEILRDDQAAMCRSRCSFTMSDHVECTYSDPFYLTAVVLPSENEVSLVTAATYHELDALVELISAWSMRLPGDKVTLARASVGYYVAHSRRDLGALTKYRREHAILREQVDFHLLYAKSATEEVPWTRLYNLAFRNTRTRARVRVDIGFIPNKALHPYLHDLVARGELTDNRVLVIPDFRLSDSAVAAAASVTPNKGAGDAGQSSSNNDDGSGDNKTGSGDDDNADSGDNDNDKDNSAGDQSGMSLAEQVQRIVEMDKTQLSAAMRKKQVDSTFFELDNCVSFDKWVGTDQSLSVPFNDMDLDELSSAQSMRFDQPFAPFFVSLSSVPRASDYVTRGAADHQRFELDALLYRMRHAGISIELAPRGFFMQSALQSAMQARLKRTQLAKTAVRNVWPHVKRWVRYKKSIKDGLNVEGESDDAAAQAKADAKSKEFFEDQLAERDRQINELRKNEAKLKDMDSRVTVLTEQLNQKTRSAARELKLRQDFERKNRELRQQLGDLEGVAKNAADFHKELTLTRNKLHMLKEQFARQQQAHEETRHNVKTFLTKVHSWAANAAQDEAQVYKIQTLAMVALAISVLVMLRHYATARTASSSPVVGDKFL